MIQRLAVYATFGLWLDSIGVSTFSVNWWCGLGLVFAIEHIAYREAEAYFDEHVAQIEELLRKARNQLNDIITHNAKEPK